MMISKNNSAILLLLCTFSLTAMNCEKKCKPLRENYLAAIGAKSPELARYFEKNYKRCIKQCVQTPSSSHPQEKNRQKNWEEKFTTVRFWAQ